MLFNVNSVIAQCAGTGTQITICDKETNPSLQAYNLFDLLTGETSGGTWISESNLNSSALDENTGIINLWGINRFGLHEFTYMNPDCDASTATVLINLGGYPGESNQNPGTNNVCQILKQDDDDTANIIDLFIFIDSINNSIVPDVDGIWTENPNNLETGLLTNEFFNFGSVPIGTYTFTYTVPTVDSCPARTATIDVEVQKSPDPGTPENLLLCETDDMSGLTAFNLFSRLEGEDSNGEWTDVSDISTGEITSGKDFEINVQNIYNNFGPGTYSFAYEVFPLHPICDEQVSIFSVCIEEQLILEGTLDVICDGLVTLTYNNTLLSNGDYDVSYTVTGNSLGTYSNTQTVNFLNGRAQFNLLPNLTLVASENLVLQIDNILASPSCGTVPLCTSSISVPNINFDMYIAPTISVSSTSGCELDDILITYQGAIDTNFTPIVGTTQVTYSINTVNYTDDVTFSNGNAVSTVPIDRFNLGNNQLIFFNTNNFIHCNDINTTSNLNLIPAPPNPVFSIIPDDKCDATSINFGFDSPSGQFISYNSVTFDIYEYGSEPQQFAPRDSSVSLVNNTQGDGVDINIINSNDVSVLPDGNYVFVIRSVQDDNAPCRGLSQSEIDNYTNQGLDVGLTLNGIEHIFDARLTFRIGEPEPVALIKNTFEVCLLSQTVTLNDLSISAGANVDIVITDLNDVELIDTYEITRNEVFNAKFKSTITNCDLGTEQISVFVVTEATSPILEDNILCNLSTNTVLDLNVSNQDIIWYNSEIGGTAYNTSDFINANNQYWAEITISGSCVSTNRTQAVISFIDKSTTPTPLINEFCSSATPTISDLLVEADAPNIQWYTSQTGEAYTSTSLPLDETMEYWVSQYVTKGCESDRVQVTYTISNMAENPEPLANNFCSANGTLYALEDLIFTETSISREGTINYFSDEAGTLSIPPTELLENVTSPIYVQQVISGTCFSDIVEVSFTLQGIAEKPVISPVSFCLDTNPTVQNLIDIIENETLSTIILYEDETSTIPINETLDLSTITGPIYASQTITVGCESTEREEVNYTLINPTIFREDFEQVHCSLNNPTLNDVYFGTDNILWFDVNNNALSSSQALQNGMSYFAQTEINTCLSSPLEIVISLVDVINPVPNSTNANFCGIEDKTIADLEEDENGNMRFTIPINNTLVWYDSNDVLTRNLLDNSTILEDRIYYAVYESTTIINGVSILCESNSVAITVDLTACSQELLIIPDAFSPNDDAINDTFELQNIEYIYPDYEIEIYNRYGRIVFKGNLEIGFWDGKSNQSGLLSNDVLPTGIYFYVIKFNQGDKKPLQGQVYLKR